MITAGILGITTVVIILLFLPKVRHSTSWRATVTPLASIIGSGFLVIAPLLTHQFGNFAVLGMLAIVTTGYAVGSAVRYNILNVEPNVHAASTSNTFKRYEALSNILLAFAYVISVSFYLQLLGAFLLRGSGLQTSILPQHIACGFLVIIGVAGYWRDLTVLEDLEEYAVSIKLAVIAGMLFGLLFFDTTIFFGTEESHFNGITPITEDNFRALLGMLIVIQGFETSRYLGREYDPSTRCKTMRRAQILSGLIYVFFIALILPLAGLQQGLDETAIIDLGGEVSWILPSLLIIAALMSQFSAAVADTVGGGGLFSEATGYRISTRQAYLWITGIALIVTLSTDIYNVVSLASRAFALYYMVQCVEAAMAARQQQAHTRAVFYYALAGLMLAIVVLGIPAE